ncbi:peptidase family C78-domain-containing protein [Crassisporium funariophilum]|nr:peptidase family C78-domain-containing protein [Crassisporium funariophilum]
MPVNQNKLDVVHNDNVIVDSMRCAFCSKSLDMMSISARETHYEHHFTMDGESVEGDIIFVNSSPEPISPKRSIKPSSSKPKEDDQKRWLRMRETDVFWYPSQTTPPPSSFTPGLIPLIRRGLLKGHARGNVRRAALCYDEVVHVHREPWDAMWGCGYRNFLMACGALMNQTQQPLYFPLLDSPIPPSIRNLQSWIEAAWKEGFDREGSKELKKLVNTKKWIGTSDLWVAFVYRGIPVQLVDFDLRNHPQGTDIVVNWVVNYFSPTATQERPTNLFESLQVSPVISTDKMPLILQHDGHSRTIVGYEVDKNGVTNLLMFDPAFRPNSEIRSKALAVFEESRLTNNYAHREVRAGDASNPSTSPSHPKRDSPEVRSHDAEEPTSSASRRKASEAASPVKKLLKSAGHGNKEFDVYAMVKSFRFNPKSLSKKKQYQILYFPMTAPLTDHERMQRKEVSSTKII